MNIEMIGLPGSGKSFLADAILDRYNIVGKQLKAINATYLLRNNTLYKIEKRIFYTFPWSNPQIRTVKNKLIKALSAKENSYKSSYGLYESFDDGLSMIAINGYYYKRLKDKADLVIYDEGPMHAIVKVATDFNLSDQEVNKLAVVVSEDKKNDLTLFNDCSVDKCIASIKKRNRHVCKFDELNDKELYELLGKYEYYTKMVSQIANAVKVSRDDPMDLKLMKIERLIK